MEGVYIISFRCRPTANSDSFELGRCGNEMCDIGVRWVSVFSETRGGEGKMRIELEEGRGGGEKGEKISQERREGEGREKNC